MVFQPDSINRTNGSNRSDVPDARGSSLTITSLRRYLVAVIAVAVALVIKLLLDPLFEQGSPFLIFFAAIMISAWYGGLGAGLLATALAALACDYFFLAPKYSLLINDPTQGLRLVIFTLEGGLISLLSGALHKARRRAEASALASAEHEAALRASEESSRIIAETASDAIITIDEESVILYVNQSAGKIFGYSTDELIGQKLPMLMPEQFRLPHRNGVRRYTETGVKHIPWKAVELPGLHKTGREIMLELSFGEFKRDGKYFFTGIARDITERKRAERRLAAQHAATRALAELTTLGEAAPRILQAIGEGLQWQMGVLWLVDKTIDALRCVELWSALQIEDNEFEEMTRRLTFARGVGLPGHTWASSQPVWIADIMKDASFQRADVAARSGLCVAFAFPISLGSETLGIIEFFSREAQPRDEELLKMMAIIGGQMGQFIERQRAEEERAALLVREQIAHAEAEANNRAKDEFLATLSHELRTPLTPIIGWTHMLRREGALTDANRALGLIAIDRNAHALARLINDLLDMSAILSGKMRIDRTPVSLEAVLREAIETVEPQAVARNIKLEFIDSKHNAVSEHVFISGDRARLIQVFWNLLTNAVKFSKDGGLVRVICKSDASEASVIIEDEGQGITSDFLPFVFDRFRQADSSATRQHGGMGIGLALVRTFVEAHDGTVKASSEGAGRGSRFTIRLPRLSVTTTGTHENAATPDTEARGLNGYRVLLVEDAPDTLQMLQTFFERRGYSVFAYESATKALYAAVGARFDIIVTDLGLPEMSGRELLKELRRLPHLQNVPAVALTGYAGAKDIEETLAAGFAAHIAKPVDPATLIAQIEELLQQSPPRARAEQMADISTPRPAVD